MSLAIKYENTDDARMRLRQTVVLYKGEPVLITDVKAGDDGGVVRVMFTPLPLAGYGIGEDDMPFKRAIKQLEGEAQRKYISSKHFDIAPFKMGYVNDRKGAFYCSRFPNRVQKQGLCGENFKGVDNHGENVGFASFTRSKEVPAMVAGNYPSFDKSIMLLEKVRSVAFSREFCLVRDEVIPDIIYLYYKGSKVGMYSKDGVGLGKKFVCLKESLQELRVKVGVL